MNDIKLKVISAVLDLLQEDLDSGNLTSEDRDGLEVAIQCMENIYDVSSVKHRSSQPSLIELYKFYLQNPHLQRREATSSEKAEAEALKVDANMAMGDGRYAEALCLYTRAIEYDSMNPVYYCNRAAAKSRMNDHYAAVRDCNMAIELDPKYSKAYGRLGLAYCGLERYVHAVECYKKAHELEPDNEGFKGNLELAKEKVKEMCCIESEPEVFQESNSSESQPSTTGNGDGPPPAPQPPFDINLLLGNQQLLNLASQVLAAPALQSLSYSLAREIPDIFNNLRQSFTTPEHAGSSSPPENETSRREDQ
ncbi:small glutamine-rich tetratricopeptide repeat-containing protein beta [Halyomorpha halys]|uniref:small glutamine-rich tetratricopeptide repeat-containing protein beta n=1 Tax=Halyomorpha halys TaxID=286706 RepID=UPI0006D4E6E8|nr:small glutamine-rich tetratricopeptide repeat-containing protein beta-like [Halyomorpha halys]